MAAMAGILNQQYTAGQALTGAGRSPMASTATDSGSTDSSSSSSASISANDFLTLLVTEMQNQDPTADTDPNEYINQLVSVNSLEQLIDINQTLSTGLGDSSTGSASGSPSTQVAAHNAGASAAAHSAASASAATGNPLSQAAGAKQAPGNLSVPDPRPAASRVAHALDGRTHAQSIAARLSGAQ
jgi:flagellar basal-body rod modification protein FlgD